MGDINFTSGWTDRLRFQHDSSGIDIDFYDRNSNTHIAGRHLDRAEVRDLVQFLAPSETVTSDGLGTTTERKDITRWSDFKAGDVVAEPMSASVPWGAIAVDRPVPVKPAEPEFGYGSAYVFSGSPMPESGQKRYRGFKSTSGSFFYLNDDGLQRRAVPDQYEDFRLED